MTSLSAQDLLQRLEPGTGPGAGRRADQTRAGQPTGAFGDLLALVSTRRSSSGRQVLDAAALDPPLSPAQFERLAAAADQAEAAGAERALMLLDGRALVMDVGRRSITGELDAAAGQELITGLDAAVLVAGDAGASPLGPPGFGVLPRNLAEQLERGNPASR